MGPNDRPGRPSPDDGQPGDATRGNAPTAIAGLPYERRDLDVAYAFARQVARQHEARMRGVYRVVWHHASGFGIVPLGIGGDAFAIVGRHTKCSVVLGDDPFLSLRHLLVRAYPLPSAGAAIRIVDLQTGIGFRLPDGSRHTSIVAEGPLALGIGAYALVILPPETREDALPQALPAPDIRPESARGDRARPAQDGGPYRANALPLNRASRITSLPQPIMVGEILPPALGRLAHGGSYALTLERDGRSATVQLSLDDLSRGVIVGRSDKCHSEALRRITDVNTSRTHVLVVREGEAIVAYDLASTQGTFDAKTPIWRRVMPEAGQALFLGRGRGQVRMIFARVR